MGDGEPPQREAVSAESSRRSRFQLSLMMTAVTHTDKMISLTAWSVLEWKARTPVRETLVLSPGDMDVLRLDTPVSTLRPLTSLTGSTTICKFPFSIKKIDKNLNKIKKFFIQKK